jgi:hypothetical protein
VQAHLAVLGQVEQEALLHMFHVLVVLAVLAAHEVRPAQLEET